MEKERIRIGTQSYRQNQAELSINAAVGVINGQLREAIESIGFEPSVDLFKDCLNGGREITQEYYLRLNSDLSSIRIPSTKIGFEKAAKEALQKFHTIREQVLNKCINTEKYISFEKEIAVFSEESKNQLFEDHGIFITEPEEIELYNLHVEACKALNAFLQGNVSLEWSRLFDVDENRQLKPESLTQYDVLCSKIKTAKGNGNK